MAREFIEVFYEEQTGEWHVKRPNNVFEQTFEEKEQAIMEAKEHKNQLGHDIAVLDQPGGAARYI